MTQCSLVESTDVSNNLLPPAFILKTQVTGSSWSRSISNKLQAYHNLIYRGADKSLARPGRKQARKQVRDARDFNNIEMPAVKIFFPLQGKAPNEIHAILTETLPCWLPGQAKDLSAPCKKFTWVGSCREFSVFSHMSRPHPGSTQPPVQRVPEFPTRALQRPERVVRCLTPPSVDVRNKQKLYLHSMYMSW